jgi:DNA polymerase-3 subunit gamma/tau
VGSDSFLDLIEIDAASNTSVDDIRDLREKVRYRPSTGRYKVYIIDEVHQLSRSAYNAFLKTLEEPPDHAIFVLATTDPHRVLATIRSRCQHLRFRRHNHTDTVAALARVADGENVMVAGEGLHVIARNSDGSLRDAIGLLDQAISFFEGTLTEQAVKDMLGLTGSEASSALADAIATADASDVMRQVHQAVQDGGNPSGIQQELVSYFRGLLLTKTGRDSQNKMDYGESEIGVMQTLATKFGVGQLVRCLELLGESGSFGRAGQSAQLELELALVNACLMMADAHHINAGNPNKSAHKDPTAPSDGHAAVTSVVNARADNDRSDTTTDTKAPLSSDKQTAGSFEDELAKEVSNRPVVACQDTKDTMHNTGTSLSDKMTGVASELNANREEFRRQLRAWSRAYEPYVMNSHWADKSGTLVLTASYPAHHDILSRKESLEMLHKIITKVLGKQIEVEITPNEDALNKSSNRTQQNNTLIDTAVTIYGAEIIDNQ